MFLRKFLVLFFLCISFSYGNDVTENLKKSHKVFALDLFTLGIKPSYIFKENLEFVFPLSYYQDLGLAAKTIASDIESDWMKAYAGFGIRWKFIQNSGWFFEPLLNLGIAIDHKAKYFAINPQAFFGYEKKWKFLRFAFAIGPQYEYRFKDKNNFLFFSGSHVFDAKATDKLKVSTLIPAGYLSFGFEI